MSDPRAKTAEEIRDEFLSHMAHMVEYWAEVKNGDDVKSRIAGFAFSVLVAIDGGSMSLPGFDLVPAPHPDDEEYMRGEGEDWYPADLVINDCQLHELWAAKYDPTRRRT